MRQLHLHVERYPIRGHFTISRGSRTEAVVLVAEIRDGAVVGRGECVPYPRYGESVETVSAEIERHRAEIEADDFIVATMPPGAARNAIDCALIDLKAKASGQPAWSLLGLAPPAPLVTAFTLSLDTPEAMNAAAAANAHRPLLKIKLGGPGDRERLTAVRAGAPQSRIIVDANEGWTGDALEPMIAACADAGVSLIEQPLPASADDILEGMPRAVPLCADESAHTSADIPRLARLYDAVNVKLDKTGGLTEALVMARAAQAAGLEIMIGCMLGSSLAMAPALLVAGFAAYVDLDGPLLLARDSEPGLRYEGSTVYPASPALWG